MDGALPPLRWWKRLPVRLSVRALMVIVLALACSLGWVVHRASVQRDAVTAVGRAGGAVRYDWQFKDGKMVPNGVPAGPAWLTRTLGPDYFDIVTNASLFGHVTDVQMDSIANLDRVDTMILDPRGLSDEGLAKLDKMTGLRWLTISGSNVAMDTRIMPLKTMSRLQGLTIAGTDITDSGLLHLSGSGRLELLDLARTKVTDSGLARLVASPGIKNLFLDDTQIGDESLSHLERLVNLENLHIKRTKITATGVEKLRRALPRATVID
jgi:hypothetical protein